MIVIKKYTALKIVPTFINDDVNAVLTHGKCNDLDALPRH